MDNQLFTFNWPAVITLIVRCSRLYPKCTSGTFVTLVIEHCLTAFFDVSNHQHSLISVTAVSKLVTQSEGKLEYVVSKYMYMQVVVTMV